MIINPAKISAVIEYYGKIKGYPEKSHLTKFTEDFKLNYKQWAAWCNGGIPAGYKIVDIFLDIFPAIDTNWLIKESVSEKEDMFLLSGTKVYTVQEPTEPIKKEITNEQIFTKLEEIHFELKSSFLKK